MGGPDDQHGVQPSFNRYGRARSITSVEDLLDVINLSFEIVGTRFLNQFLPHLALPVTVMHGIMAAFEIDKPFKKAFRPLYSRCFLRGLGDHILDDIPHQTDLSLDTNKTNSVIFNDAIIHNVHRGRNLSDTSRTDKTGTKLPDVYGVRVLHALPTSPFKKSA